MANREIWGGGLGVGFTWTTAINGSDMASLASGSTVLSSVSDITNQTALDLFADISVRMTLASTTFQTGANVALWLAALLDDGATYGDGSMTSGGTVTRNLPYGPIGVVTVQSAVAATLVAGFVQGVLIPPGSFRLALGNNLVNNSGSGVALSVTAGNNVVKYRTYVLNLNG
jgi:hypothetical protein